MKLLNLATTQAVLAALLVSATPARAQGQRTQPPPSRLDRHSSLEVNQEGDDRRRRRARASPQGRRLGRLGELVPVGVPPEAFERVEVAALAAEDVHDEVEVIEQDPL